MSPGSILGDVVSAVHDHPGLRGKRSIRLVTDVFGASDWLAGPGDDGAVITVDGRQIVVGGEALWPPFVESDPYGAGIAAVLANVNDLAAMGARPLAILDTVVAPEPVARSALEGMRDAANVYEVSVVGGHLTVRDGPPSLSAFGIGTAQTVLSARNVAPGQVLLVATCLEGHQRSDFPFFSSIAERASHLAGDVRLLAELAEAGVCLAAKDVSMAGLLGSLAMLLEWSGAGVEVDLSAVPRPDGVCLPTWVITFPAYSFVLTAPAGSAERCRAAFLERDLDCECVGVLDASGAIRVRLDGETRLLLDLTEVAVTGLRAQG